MAELWASTSDGGRPPRQGEPRSLRRPTGAHGTGTAAPRSPHGRRGERLRHSRGLVALLLIGLPLVGALVDEAIAPGLGLIFGGCAVAGTAAATALASRAGWWWVLPTTPTVVLGVSAAAELLGDSAKYQGTKALATGAARWSINGFPVMLAALGAATAVILIRIPRDKRNRRG